MYKFGEGKVDAQNAHVVQDARFSFGFSSKIILAR